MEIEARINAALMDWLKDPSAWPDARIVPVDIYPAVSELVNTIVEARQKAANEELERLRAAISPACSIESATWLRNHVVQPLAKLRQQIDAHRETTEAQRQKDFEDDQKVFEMLSHRINLVNQRLDVLERRVDHE